MGCCIKEMTWDFVFFAICFTKLLLINTSTESSLEMPVLFSPPISHKTNTSICFLSSLISV